MGGFLSVKDLAMTFLAGERDSLLLLSSIMLYAASKLLLLLVMVFGTLTTLEVRCYLSFLPCEFSLAPSSETMDDAAPIMLESFRAKLLLCRFVFL